MVQKQCRTCGEWKSLDQFHKGKTYHLGRIPDCRDCKRVLMADKYKRDWYSFQHRLKKSESKKKGIPYDLDPDYLESLMTESCPVFGTKFTMFDKRRSDSPSLDRVNPNEGYVKGNVRYISHRANRIKYDATIDELQKVIKYMEGATTIPNGSTLK